MIVSRGASLLRPIHLTFSQPFRKYFGFSIWSHGTTPPPHVQSVSHCIQRMSGPGWTQAFALRHRRKQQITTCHLCLVAIQMCLWKNVAPTTSFDYCDIWVEEPCRLFFVRYIVWSPSTLTDHHRLFSSSGSQSHPTTMRPQTWKFRPEPVGAC